VASSHGSVAFVDKGYTDAPKCKFFSSFHEFKREVERHLTGKETETWEMIYFKLYKSQFAGERALEVAGMMLGTDKSRGYCLGDDLRRFLRGCRYFRK
jgi:hypothetical protein